MEQFSRQTNKITRWGRSPKRNPTRQIQAMETNLKRCMGLSEVSAAPASLASMRREVKKTRSNRMQNRALTSTLTSRTEKRSTGATWFGSLNICCQKMQPNSKDARSFCLTLQYLIVTSASTLCGTIATFASFKSRIATRPVWMRFTKISPKFWLIDAMTTMASSRNCTTKTFACKGSSRWVMLRRQIVEELQAKVRVESKCRTCLGQTKIWKVEGVPRGWWTTRRAATIWGDFLAQKSQ